MHLSEWNLYNTASSGKFYHHVYGTGEVVVWDIDSMAVCGLDAAVVIRVVFQLVGGLTLSWVC